MSLFVSTLLVGLFLPLLQTIPIFVSAVLVSCCLDYMSRIFRYQRICSFTPFLSQMLSYAYYLAIQYQILIIRPQFQKICRSMCIRYSQPRLASQARITVKSRKLRSGKASRVYPCQSNQDFRPATYSAKQVLTTLYEDGSWGKVDAPAMKKVKIDASLVLCFPALRGRRADAYCMHDCFLRDGW
jgi:hypothetical protein